MVSFRAAMKHNCTVTSSFLALTTTNNIEIVPTEKIRIRVLPGRGSGSSASLHDAWTSNTDRPSVMTFHISCGEREEYCNQLADAMKNTPEMFVKMFQLDCHPSK